MLNGSAMRMIFPESFDFLRGEPEKATCVLIKVAVSFGRLYVWISNFSEAFKYVVIVMKTSPGH